MARSLKVSSFVLVADPHFPEDRFRIGSLIHQRSLHLQFGVGNWFPVGGKGRYQTQKGY